MKTPTFEAASTSHLRPILMIEDNPGDARLITEFLKEVPAPSSFNLHCAATLSEGLSLLARQAYDLVLLDLSLPDASGVDIVARLQKEYSSVPVVVLTGLSDEAMAIQAVQMGAQDYLVKGTLDGIHLSRAIRHAIERKRIEEALRFQMTLLACESEASLDGILIVLNSQQIHSWNSRFLELWRISEYEIETMSEPQLFSRLKSQLMQPKLLSAESSELGGTPANRQPVEILLRDGRMLEFFSSPILSPEDHHYGRAWYFRDVSERKRIEQMKDEFISTVSHELRTPLAIVKGAIANLKDGIAGPLDERQSRVVEISYRNVERLSRLINDLLDLSRLESGKSRIQRRLVSTTHLFSEVIQNFQSEADEKNLRLLPQIESGVADIYADYDMVMQVLNNLMNNALRFAKNQVVLHARPVASQTSESEKQHYVMLSVCDDGIGIEPDSMKLLFNKFQQINRPMGGAGYKGTGLGLAICREIVDLHQGRIWAESSVGEGTQFHFEVPSYEEETDFRVTLAETIDRSSFKGENLAVIAFHVDNLKELRQEVAESTLKACLGDVAHRIRSHDLRRIDTLYHYTPADFMLIINKADERVIGKVVERVRETFKTQLAARTSLPLQLQYGFAIYPHQALSAERLVEVALRNLKSLA